MNILIKHKLKLLIWITFLMHWAFKFMIFQFSFIYNFMTLNILDNFEKILKKSNVLKCQNKCGLQDEHSVTLLSSRI